MAEPDTELDLVFQALMHATRRDMLRRLADGELSVGELAAPLPVSLAAASKHVQVLERAGLVRRTVVGRRHVFRRDPHRLDAATEWLTHQGDAALAAPVARSTAATEKAPKEKAAQVEPPKPDVQAAAKDKASQKDKTKDKASTKDKSSTKKTGRDAKGKKSAKDAPQAGKADKRRSGKKGKHGS